MVVWEEVSLVTFLRLNGGKLCRNLATIDWLSIKLSFQNRPSVLNLSLRCYLSSNGPLPTGRFKGAWVFELESTFENEALTIRYVTLENQKTFDRKYLAAYPDGITVILYFFNSDLKVASFQLSRIESTRIDL